MGWFLLTWAKSIQLETIVPSNYKWYQDCKTCCSNLTLFDFSAENCFLFLFSPILYAIAWSNLANILKAKGDLLGAENAYRNALSHRGNMADAHYNL